MKFKYIFPLFIAMIALMVSCSDEKEVTLLDDIRVSSSTVAIPEDGGSKTITVKAKDSWTVEKVVSKKDSVKWLNISTISGSAGESEITFSAESSIDGRKAEVLINSGGKTQRINIVQGVMKISEATVAEVIAGPDGKTFRVTGVCTEIQNTEYGNWILADETGSLLVYGTLDKKGNTKNFKDWGMEVGDEVTVEGPKTTYGSTIELVDVTVVSITKSLVRVDSVENEVLPLEGGIFTAHLYMKGEGLSINIPENAKSWLTIESIESKTDSVKVNLKAAPNAGGDRSTTVVFRTVDTKGKEYSSETTISQKGSIVKATMAEFLAAEVGDTQYRLTGVITKMANAKYGNVDLKDFSGQTYVYGLDNYEEGDLKAGDIITLVGRRASHNGNPQVAGGVLEETKPVTAVSDIADFLGKSIDANVYYMVTGKIKSIDAGDYGNMTLMDDSGEIYAYGCYPGYGATGDDRKGLVAEKGIKVGDTITIIGTRGAHNNVDQLANGFYFSHETQAEE